MSKSPGKSRKCPTCHHAGTIRTILYGMPMYPVDESRYVLGGCVIDEDTPRGRFLELFRDETESPLMKETTILQALAMMNGEFIDNATTLDKSQTLRAVADFPLMTNDEKLDTLFVAALSRQPTDSERATFSKFITDGGTTGDAKSAMADVFWALLNSSEFLLNH